MFDCALKTMLSALASILGEPSVYLYGSAVDDDFKPGWSDIDLLVLTDSPLTDSQAQKLLRLRQELVEAHGEPLYRSFEGAILPHDAFVGGSPATVVYWGTSGERIRDRYSLDPTSQKQLIERGRVLLGADRRAEFPAPTFAELVENVRRHYETIRAYARETDRSLYSYGWLLDISRCLFTLETGGIIAKTAAAEWALERGLCPVETELNAALRVRRDPALFEREEVKDYAASLGPAIQRSADVLAKFLDNLEE